MKDVMKKTKGIRISMQYFAEQTKISDLIDPEVMSDMIDAKISSKIVVSPFAKIDRTLTGVPGDTITVPQYKYIGDAVDVAEGVEAETVKLETDSTQAKVKKAMKAVDITDEAVLSGYGNPVGQATSQLAMSIAAKVDADSMDALMKAQLTYDGSSSAISYNGIVDAVDKFNEELNTEKAMFINPHQNSQLRKDPNFISADKYDGNVVMTGEIGKIANCRIVPSKKVALNEAVPEQYVKADSGDTNAKEVVADTASSPTSSQVKLSAVTPCSEGYIPKVGDYVVKNAAVAAGTFYTCPIIKLNADSETEDDTAALTIYLKRDTNVETERESKKRSTVISADKHYTVAISDQSKVVLAKFKK